VVGVIPTYRVSPRTRRQAQGPQFVEIDRDTSMTCESMKPRVAIRVGQHAEGRRQRARGGAQLREALRLRARGDRPAGRAAAQAARGARQLKDLQSRPRQRPARGDARRDHRQRSVRTKMKDATGAGAAGSERGIGRMAEQIKKVAIKELDQLEGRRPARADDRHGHQAEGPATRPPSAPRSCSKPSSRSCSTRASWSTRGVTKTINRGSRRSTRCSRNR